MFRVFVDCKYMTKDRNIKVPVALTFTFGRNLSGQITSIGASDGAFLSRPGVTKTEAVTSNRLNQVSSVVGPGGTSTYTHDANGNLTSDGALVFAYDEENRLRTVALLATPGTPFASYEYDPLGRRRAKVVNGVATRYLSDGAEEIEERNGANGLLRQFVNGAGIDEHLAIVDATLCPGGGRCFLRTNWQGSTTHLVAQSGALVETYHYGPYGERLDWTPQDGDSGNPYRYTGRRYDAETGLYYYRARYYSPKLGRFLQTDPIGGEDDLNLYAYVGSDPANKTDPTGEFALVGAGIGALVDVAIQVGTNLASGQDLGDAISNVDGRSVALSAALGAVGNVGGGRALTTLARGLSNETKGKIGEAVARIGIAARGERVIARGERAGNVSELGRLSGRAQNSKPDFVVRTPEGSTAVVEAKFGNSQLTPAQRELRRQSGDFAFRTSRTSYDDVSRAGGASGAVAGGAAGNCIGGAAGPCQR